MLQGGLMGQEAGQEDYDYYTPYPIWKQMYSLFAFPLWVPHHLQICVQSSILKHDPISPAHHTVETKHDLRNGKDMIEEMQETLTPIS